MRRADDPVLAELYEELSRVVRAIQATHGGPRRLDLSPAAKAARVPLYEAHTRVMLQILRRRDDLREAALEAAA